tara:strand:- start:307 stop:444 length:138 start_codon:yes stop_codon:yes gene_type:complete
LSGPAHLPKQKRPQFLAGVSVAVVMQMLMQHVNAGFNVATAFLAL